MSEAVLRWPACVLIVLLCSVCSQEGWLELDAYYTGANRCTDPSDIVAPGAKPDGILPSDSAVDLTRPQAHPSALKTTPADDGHGHIIRYAPCDCRVVTIDEGLADRTPLMLLQTRRAECEGLQRLRTLHEMLARPAIHCLMTQREGWW